MLRSEGEAELSLWSSVQEWGLPSNLELKCRNLIEVFFTEGRDHAETEPWFDLYNKSANPDRALEQDFILYLKHGHDIDIEGQHGHENKGYMHTTVGDFKVLISLLEMATEDDIPERLMRREVRAVIQTMKKDMEETIRRNAQKY